MLFREYIWLLETINKRGETGITFEDLCQKWSRNTLLSDGVPLARSTFNRHRSAIQDIFGITIICKNFNGEWRYRLKDLKLIEKSSVQNWMLSTLSVNNKITDCVSIHDRILLEPIPAGGEILEQLLQALKESRVVEMTYCRYRKEPKVHIVEPYCLKLFRQRWYILGHCVGSPKGQYLLFSLDRIKELSVTDQKFKSDRHFVANDFFAEYYGAMLDQNREQERILIRAYNSMPDYLRDLPLHHSQVEVAMTEEYTDFELFLRPTTDFCSKILSQGNWLEVLKPIWLRQQIYDTAAEVMRRYEPIVE